LALVRHLLTDRTVCMQRLPEDPVNNGQV